MTSHEVKEKLTQSFPDSQIEVIDLTGTSDHFQVMIESIRFAGLSRIKQHQLVMEALAAELKSGEVHALAIKTQIKNEEYSK